VSGERLRTAAREIRRVVEAVECSDLYAPGRVVPAITDLDRLGFFRTDVARLVADWLDASGADLASAGGHISSCDEPGSLWRASEMADLILDGPR